MTTNGNKTEDKILNEDDNRISINSSAKESFKLWIQQISKYLPRSLEEEHKKRHENVSGVLEDLQTRLSEFEHLLEMTQADVHTCMSRQAPKIKEKYHEMEMTFEKIDRLEMLVARVKEQMDEMERHLAAAEATVQESPASFISFVPMFFNHRNIPSLSQVDNHKPPDVFSTDHYFKAV